MLHFLLLLCPVSWILVQMYPSQKIDDYSPAQIYLTPAFEMQKPAIYCHCSDQRYFTLTRPTPESILGRTLRSKYSPTVGTAIFYSHCDNDDHHHNNHHHHHCCCDVIMFTKTILKIFVNLCICKCRGKILQLAGGFKLKPPFLLLFQMPPTLIELRSRIIVSPLSWQLSEVLGLFITLID